MYQHPFLYKIKNLTLEDMINIDRYNLGILFLRVFGIPKNFAFIDKNCPQILDDRCLHHLVQNLISLNRSSLMIDDKDEYLKTFFEFNLRNIFDSTFHHGWFQTLTDSNQI